MKRQRREHVTFKLEMNMGIKGYSVTKSVVLN